MNLSKTLKYVSNILAVQSGPMGQQTSVFNRGTNSNHTLVLLNGIAINDQSVTDGLHDFGQDFVETIEQIEVYKSLVRKYDVDYVFLFVSENDIHKNDEIDFMKSALYYKNIM